MTHRLKKISMLIGLSSLTLGTASAACIDHVAAQDDGTITRAGLVAYNECMKAEMDIPRPPIKLSTSTWDAACTGGSSTTNGCFAASPASNASTKLVMQVTNIFGLANLPSPNTSPASYTAGTIWIGKYPLGGNHALTTTTATGNVPVNTQGICSAYDETGWPVPLNGMNTGNPVPDPGITTAGGLVVSIPNGPVPAIQMTTNPLNAPASLSIPLYIICVGRSMSGTPFTPGDLTGTVGGFDIAWG
jgi:hypothetical protein